MPDYDELGHVIPSPEDPPDMRTAVHNLSLSNPGIVNVASRTEANAIRQAYMDVAGNEHIVNPPQMMIWDYNRRLLEVESGVGGGWEYLAGRQHGATVNFVRTDVAQATDPPRAVFPTSFVRASAGWTLDSSSNLVIPQTGMYVMSVDFSMTKNASTAGRAFFQLVSQNSAFGNRFPAYNENNWGGTIMWPLSAGNTLRLQAYHEGGGDRDYSGTLQIAMINAPNW